MRVDLSLNRRRWIASALFAGWVASLAVPALAVNNGFAVTSVTGLMILLTGWYGIYALQFGWFANLLLLVSLALFVRRRVHRRALRIAAILLVACAVQALPVFWEDVFGRLEAIFAGYFLWMGIVLLTAALMFAASFHAMTDYDDQPV